MSMFFKVVVTIAVVIAAIPGLILEPGPLSEITAVSILIGLWGGDKTPEEAAEEVAEGAAGES